MNNCSTARDVVREIGDLSNHVIMVTGASSGIGLETSTALAIGGATVIMACRAGKKAMDARQKILSRGIDETKVILIDLDLGSKDSIEKCSADFLKLDLPLHALVNNAGINGVAKWGEYSPGIETQFAVNFLGHVYLANRLHSLLVKTPGSRIVAISSESHRRVSEKNFDFDREVPPKPEHYDSLHGYAFSNLCRLWWVRAVAKKVPYPIVAIHPGVVGGTGMMQHMSLWTKIKQIVLVALWEGKSASAMQSVGQVAKTQTWAAIAPVDDLQKISGSYLNGNAGQVLGVPMEPSVLGQRDDFAERITKYAEEYFNISFASSKI